MGRRPGPSIEHRVFSKAFPKNSTPRQVERQLEELLDHLTYEYKWRIISVISKGENIYQFILERDIVPVWKEDKVANQMKRSNGTKS